MSIVSVFAVLFLAMLLGMVMNVGRHVDGKLRMQNAADSAAYSGGVVLARGMNTLAFTNHLLCDVFAVTAILREARDQNSASYAPEILAAWSKVAPVFSSSGFPKFTALGSAIQQKVPLEQQMVNELLGLGQVGERPGPADDGGDPVPGVDSQVSAGRRGCLSGHRPVGGPGDGLAERRARPPPRSDVRRAVADRRPAGGRRRRIELLARRPHLARRRSGTRLGGEPGPVCPDGGRPAAVPVAPVPRSVERRVAQRLRSGGQDVAVRRPVAEFHLRIPGASAQRGVPEDEPADGDLREPLRRRPIRTPTLQKHYIFIGVVYWKKLPEAAPGLFKNPLEADDQAFAEVHLFIPRDRLEWVPQGGSGGRSGPSPLGGVPGQIAYAPMVSRQAIAAAAEWRYDIGWSAAWEARRLGTC